MFVQLADTVRHVCVFGLYTSELSFFTLQFFCYLLFFLLKLQQIQVVLVLDFEAFAFQLVYRLGLLLLQLVELLSGLHYLVETPHKVFAVEKVYLFPEGGGESPDAEF